MSTSAAITDNLPTQLTPFIGRRGELAEIARLLADPTCRLLTLVGPGGIGKTRLAIEAAQQIALPNEVYFVPLQPLTSSDFILSTIAEVLHAQFYAGSEPKQQLLDYFRDKSALLVLDNLEHLLDGIDLLSQILAAAPDVRILATSRERLNLQEEWVLDVVGLRYPTNEAETDTQDYSAVELFVQHARRMKVGFALNETDKLAVIRICQMVGGMPLGIELASAWVRALSCEKIANELERSLDILETPVRNVPERHRNMRAVFEPTWERLSADERAVFMKLSVFRGGFTWEAAEYVTRAALRTLSALVDKSLLRVDANGRYDLHELLRQFGEEQLDVSLDESSQVHDSHCAYYAEFLAQEWEHLNGRRQKEALQEIEAEIGNIRAGWLWAIEHNKEEQIGKAVDGLWFFYDIRGRYQEGAQLFRMAVEALAAHEPKESLILGKLIARQGMLYFTLSLPKEAGTLLQDSLAIFRRHDARGEIANALFRLGEVTMFLENDFQRAQQHFQESLALYQEIGDPQGMAFALAWLGFVAYSLGDFWETRRLGGESLALCQGLDSQLEMAMALIVLSSAATELGEYPEAKRLAQESLRISQEIGINYATAHALNVVGGATCALGEYSESKQYLYEALKLAHESSFMPWTMYALAEIASLLAELGEKERALEVLALPLYHPAHYEARRHTMTRLYARLEAELPPQIFTAALERGKALDLDTTVKELLTELSQSLQDITPDSSITSPLSGPDSLTERELEILHLIANGLSNREIAEQLIIAPGTTKWYTNQIYSKLHVASRTQAVARARELKLLP